MSQINIDFIYDGESNVIQCEKTQKFKDLCKKFTFKVKAENKSLLYMYNGISLENDELCFDEIANSVDKQRNKMSVLVIENGTQILNNNCVIKSNKIICPQCKENIKFSIDDYLINLFDCKNKHDIGDIFLDEFELNQNINISKIICQNCKVYSKANVHDNIFYRCNSCKKDLCPICYSNHDKNHKIINYDDKNYICEEHNNKYNAYCEDCKENICTYCEKNIMIIKN